MTKSVFISGLFNSVHAGHIRLMTFARKLAPKLIVGIYGDGYKNSVFGRPLSERLMALKSLNLIDEIVVIESDISAVLRSVQPSFIVKGSEFQGEVNVESTYIDENKNCQIVFSPGEIGFFSEDNQFEIQEKKFSYHDQQFLEKHNLQFKRLHDITCSFKDLRVAVIGETIVDDYIECTPLGMSQEDPTIVVKPIAKKRFLGGAAIVAAHAKSLGAKVEFFTSLGKDPEGAFAKEKLKEFGVEYKIFYQDFRSTILKTRYRANGKTLLRVSRVQENPVEGDIQIKLIETLRKILIEADVLIFSDFNYGLITDQIISAATQICNAHKVIIAADSQSSSQIGDISRFKNVDLITPTEREGRLALKGRDIGLTALCEELKIKCNAKHVILTMAEKGLLVHSDIDEENWRTDEIKALNNYPVDVAGAGDSFLTAAALSLAVKASIWEASYIGSVAASLQVANIGNIPIDLNELKKRLIDTGKIDIEFNKN